MIVRTCACGKKIPLTVTIDSRSRNLQHRKRCLSCLPFGTARGRWHGVKTRTVDEESEVRRQRWRAAYEAKRTEIGKCPITAMRIARKALLLSWFNSKCQLCSYNKCPRNLAFHHLDPAQKASPLNVSACQAALPKILMELIKCVLLCNNCHGEVHAGLIATKKLVELSTKTRATVAKVTAISWRQLGLEYGIRH